MEVSMSGLTFALVMCAVQACWLFGLWLVLSNFRPVVMRQQALSDSMARRLVNSDLAKNPSAASSAVALEATSKTLEDVFPAPMPGTTGYDRMRNEDFNASGYAGL